MLPDQNGGDRLSDKAAPKIGNPTIGVNILPENVTANPQAAQAMRSEYLRQLEHLEAETCCLCIHARRHPDALTCVACTELGSGDVWSGGDAA